MGGAYGSGDIFKALNSPAEPQLVVSVEYSLKYAMLEVLIIFIHKSNKSEVLGICISSGPFYIFQQLKTHRDI